MVYKFRIAGGLLVAFICAILAETVAAAQPPTILNFAHGGSIHHQYHVAAKKFAELVRAKTNGQLQIAIFPNGELGSEGVASEGVRLGSIDMAVIASGGMLANWVPEIQVFDLPYLFRDRPHAYAVLDGAVGRDLNRKIAGVGIENLAYWEIGVRHLTNNVRPIVTTEDVRGLKMRVMPVKVYIKTAQALGANVLPIAFSELYGSLQRGIVNGQENPLATIRSMKFYEAQKYLTLTGHAYSPALVVINQQRYQQLPEAWRLALRTAAREAAEYQRQLIQAQEASDLEFLERHGMTINHPKNLQSFRDATAVVYKQMDNDIPRELLDKIRATPAKQINNTQHAR